MNERRCNQRPVMALSLLQKRRVLLGLTDAEIRGLVEADNDADFEELGLHTGLEADGVRGSISDAGFVETTRLDPNQMRREQWAQIPGLMSADIDRILLGGPYYTMAELFAATDLPRSVVRSLFRIAPYNFVDPITKREIVLTPVMDEYILPPSETERDPAEEAGYVDISATVRTGLRVVAANDFDTLKCPHDLKRHFKGQVTPVMRDQHGAKRYLVPGAMDVWFKTEVDERNRASILTSLNLEITAKVPEVGYYRTRLLRIPESGDVVHAVLSTIKEALGKPGVVFAEPDQLGFADFEPDADQPIADDDFETLDRYWNEAVVDLAGAHAITRGSKDVTILVADSGCRMDHEALAPAFPENWTSLDLSFGLDEPQAASSPHEIAVSHGTKVAGVVRRIAPDCHILPLRVPGTAGGMAAPGYGLRAAAILSALDYVPAGKHAVMNLSWKTNGEHIGIREALRSAESRGVVLVVSAGNYGVGASQHPDELHYPSAHSYLDPVNTALVVVAALAPGDMRASYSYYGAKAITVAAPGGEPGGVGSGIHTTSTPPPHTYTSGTSFAAPHVAGLAALLFSVKPAMTAAQVIATITSTADKLNVVNPGYVGLLGAGRINAQRALEAVAGPATTHTVTATAGAHGTVFPPGAVLAPAGGSQRFDFLPDPGHAVADILVDAISIGAPAMDSHTLSGIDADHTVHVTFSEEPIVAEVDDLVNLNTATSAHLAALPYIGVWLADQIVAYRDAHGPYGTIWDLTAVGMSDWAIGQVVSLITV
jgi:subtilisin family serine protease